jgi:hypothetical protein
MASYRIIAPLFLLAAGLLLAAVVFTTGGPAVPVNALPTIGLPGLPGVTALPPIGQVLPSGLALTPTLLLGFVLGWLAHWLFALPWGNLPAAIMEWLLGWRRSVVMTGFAALCMAVLLLY